MNRRNALLGLGAIATGGGALFGSGAFSQVTATREVTISVNDDQNANLALAANGTTTVANNTSDTNELGIDADKLNPDADTTYKVVFDITNDSPDNDDKLVAVESPTFSSGTAVFKAYPSVAGNTIGTIVDLSSNWVTINAGATLVVGMEVQVNDTSSTTESSSVTIEAVEDSADFTLGVTDSGETETS
jgi:hypothetical protein